MILALEIVLAGLLTGAALAGIWMAVEAIHERREYNRELDTEYFLLCLSEDK